MNLRIINNFFRNVVAREVVKLCINYPSYSVGIFINDWNNEEILTEELLEIIPCVEIDRVIATTKNEPTKIRFKNGSYLHIFNGTEVRCMPRYGTIVYDKDLDREYVDRVIIPLRVHIQRCGRLLSLIRKIGF